MRIGIDATVLEAGHRTGVARYLQNLVAQWSREPRGHSFVAYHSRLAPPDEALHREPFRLSGLLPIPFVQSYAHPQRLLWEQVALPLRAERDGISVLFSPGYTAPLRSPCPGVVTVHDISFSVRPEWYAPPARWLLGSLCRASTRRRQAVLTDSDFSRREILRVYGVPPARVFSVPIAGDPRFSVGDAGAAAVRAQELIGSSEPFILFVGTMYRRRRVASLIRAFDRVAGPRAGIRLLLIGSDPDGEAVRGRSEAAARDRILVLPHVTEEDLLALYRSCAAFVYVSEYEGFGLPVIEALACGAPVVTSRTASLPEVAGDAALFVPLDDEEALADTLLRLLTDRALGEDLRGRGPSQAARFDWAECAARTLDILEQAAGASGTPPSATLTRIDMEARG